MNRCLLSFNSRRATGNTGHSAAFTFSYIHGQRGFRCTGEESLLIRISEIYFPVTPQPLRGLLWGDLISKKTLPPKQISGAERAPGQHLLRARSLLRTAVAEARWCQREQRSNGTPTARLGNPGECSLLLPPLVVTSRLWTPGPRSSLTWSGVTADRRGAPRRMRASACLSVWVISERNDGEGGGAFLVSPPSGGCTVLLPVNFGKIR